MDSNELKSIIAENEKIRLESEQLRAELREKIKESEEAREALGKKSYLKTS